MKRLEGRPTRRGRSASRGGITGSNDDQELLAKLDNISASDIAWKNKRIALCNIVAGVLHGATAVARYLSKLPVFWLFTPAVFFFIGLSVGFWLVFNQIAKIGEWNSRVCDSPSVRRVSFAASYASGYDFCIAWQNRHNAPLFDPIQHATATILHGEEIIAGRTPFDWYETFSTMYKDTGFLSIGTRRWADWYDKKAATDPDRYIRTAFEHIDAVSNASHSFSTADGLGTRNLYFFKGLTRKAKKFKESNDNRGPLMHDIMNVLQDIMPAKYNPALTFAYEYIRSAIDILPTVKERTAKLKNLMETLDLYSQDIGLYSVALSKELKIQQSTCLEWPKPNILNHIFRNGLTMESACWRKTVPTTCCADLLLDALSERVATITSDVQDVQRSLDAAHQKLLAYSNTIAVVQVKMESGVLFRVDFNFLGSEVEQLLAAFDSFEKQYWGRMSGTK
jgi:hypothetical protein